MAPGRGAQRRAAARAPTVAEHLEWLVLLFGAIALHELAHGIVARRYGSPVREIDLLPIGGVSRLGRLPDDPRQQLRIALAGLLASIGIGVAAGVLALVANLWLVVIGLFVYAGSRIEETATVVQGALDDVRVRDVMVAAVPPTLSGVKAGEFDNLPT